MDRLRLLPSAERDAEGEVARLRARAVSIKSPRPERPIMRLRLGAIGPAEAHQLGEAARDQRRRGAGAEPAAGNDAGGDRQHVLGGAADLDAAHVGRMIGPEGRRADRLRQRGRKRLVGRGERDGGRQAARDVGSKARSGQDRRHCASARIRR